MKTQTTGSRLREVIKTKLSARTIEQLKNDARVAMGQDSHGANLIFVTATNILEERLSESDYKAFEDSL